MWTIYERQTQWPIYQSRATCLSLPSSCLIVYHSAGRPTVFVRPSVRAPNYERTVIAAHICVSCIITPADRQCLSVRPCEFLTTKGQQISVCLSASRTSSSLPKTVIAAHICAYPVPSDSYLPCLPTKDCVVVVSRISVPDRPARPSAYLPKTVR